VSASKYKALEDSNLVGLCLDGDAHAWEALIVRYRRLIYSIPVKFNLSSADAGDVFQSVCLKLIEHLRELKDERKVSAWLITTTTRQCIQVRSHRHRETTTEEEFEEPESPGANVEEIQIQAQEHQTLREAIEELPERCRSLLQMLYFDSKSPSYETIAATLDMPVPSIGPTRARCLEKLKGFLRRRGIK
jgi:RNA polymerase sigma factor (sigma-70 family)